MEYSNNIPRSALDFKGYGELKAQATRNEKMATKEVAKQFEAMFVQMMLKSMRAAVPRNEENRSKTMETFEQMYDREIAVAMSRRGGLGLAEMIETHLDKINVSSKDILEGRFKLNNSFPLERDKKSLELKTGETQTSIPLNRPKIENRLNFNPLTNINNRNEKLENNNNNIGSYSLISKKVANEFTKYNDYQFHYLI